PGFWSNIRTKGDIHFYRNEFMQAEEEYRKLLNKTELSARAWCIYKLGCLHQIHGRYQNSKEKTEEGLELSEKIGQSTWIRGTRAGLSTIERKLGHLDKALEELKKIRDMAVKENDFRTQRETMRDMGLVYLEMKAFDKAENTANQLREMAERSPIQKSIWNYYYLMGMIELAKKNASKAIEYLKEGQLLLAVTNAFQLLFSDALGSAYHLAGDLENAQKEYEKIALLNTGRFEYGDTYVKSFYNLGRISEERGLKAKASEYYEKFLDLWKDADPGIAEVKDAQKRLAGLKTD
ncbi:MAG: hypothetical protein JXB23_14980, partial [Candidatus Aminicenantes bacterium]|nr:hypothetical protein [Candidatus Aminicenantes bacterium]